MATTTEEVAQIIAANRLRKATALADALQAKHFTFEEVRRMDAHGWHIAAVSAGTKPPSEDTQTLVLQILDQREAQ